MSNTGRELFLKKAPEESTRRISVLLVAFVSAAVHSCLGVIFAPLFSLAFLATGLSESAFPSGSGFTYGPVVFPAAYAVIGFMIGAAAALLYNKLAGEVFGRRVTPEIRNEPVSS